MKTKSITITYNPNEHIRDTVYLSYISKRPHATWTPSKVEKQLKQERKNKQRGYF